MNNQNTLAIDAGNTRIKWGLFNADGIIIEQGACLHAALSMLSLPVAARIVVSNVADTQIQAQLKALLATHVAIHWITAQPEACGVNNHYENPKSLGSDRWAALIAAWHIKQAPCVVVNAGTAVTIDALSVQPNAYQNTAAFIGGLILPGFDLMQHSLGIATAKLPKKLVKLDNTTQDESTKKIDMFAKNTTNAIYAGALYAITGAIKAMVRELGEQTKKLPYIVISGGNAAIIYAQLHQDYPTGKMTKGLFIVDNLVLQGLFLLDNSNTFKK